MFTGGKVLRLIPDQPNSGGSKTAQSTFSQNMGIRVARNIWVYQGRWQKSPGLSSFAQPPVGAQGITRSYSAHTYLKYDLTDASLGPTSDLLTHDYAAGTTTHYINQYYIESGVRSVPIKSSTATGMTPALFANIKNRCFICWSGTNPFIFDGVGTLYNPNDYTYDIGVQGPVSAPTYTIQDVGDHQGDASTVYISAAAGGNTVTACRPGSPTPVFSGSELAVGIGGITYNLVSPGGYTYYNATTVDASSPSCTGSSGTKTLTINGYLFPANGAWNGLKINIAAPSAESVIVASYTLGATDTTVTLVANLASNHTTASWTLSGEVLTFATAYQGATVLGTLRVFGYAGAMAWTDQGPQYAYAYYDPVTGHISNISPILQVTETAQPGVAIGLDGIMPSPSTDQTRFTDIVIFRTQLAGGAVLYPIGTFGYPPTFDTVANTGAVPHTYIDNNTDAALLINGGLIAPLVNNAKPGPATHMMVYDQRVWLNPVDDPTAIIYSADFYQVPFGVPEESFAPGNLLRISSDDGRVRGMKLVGNLAEVMTDRYSYAIVGGPDAASYRLTRIGPQTFGVGDYQMAELPGDIGDNSAALSFLSRDKRVYLLAPQYGNVPLSDPVSDTFETQIATADDYYNSRLHYFQAPNVRLLMASLPSATMTFNFDQKIWCQTDAAIEGNAIIRPEAFTTVYGGTRPTDLVVVNAGFAYAWMRIDESRGSTNAYLETPPMSLAGDQKRRTRLNFVRVYTDAPTVTVTLTIDESNSSLTMIGSEEPDVNYSLYANPSSPVDDPDAHELVAFPVASLTGGLTAKTDGFRHMIRVSLPEDQSRYSIYAIDIGYQIIDADGEVNP